jgi:hypothetical protein
MEGVMRQIFVVGCVLIGWVDLVRADDVSSVSEHVMRYTTAVFKRDKGGLESLLRKDYQGRSLPASQWLGGEVILDKDGALSHWSNRDLHITRFGCKIESVRVFGDTAIETGSMSGELSVFRSPHTFGQVGYTRV